MRKIAIEEHLWVPELKSFLEDRQDYPKVEGLGDKAGVPPPEMMTKLLDVEDIRLKDMDKNGIDMQILSSTLNLGARGQEGVEAARKFNNYVGSVLKKHPTRYAGFATISSYDPVAAAKELERAVKDLGMKGAMIPSSIGPGEWWDNDKYWIIFEKAAKLGVPVYIHPTYVNMDMVKAFMPYPHICGALGVFPADTGLAAMRMICSGIFDKYPGFNLILGHLGEALPYWLWRIDNRWKKEHVTENPLAKKLAHGPGYYIKNNIYCTTSGMAYQPALQCAILSMGIDRILFAVDYPWEPSNEMVEFLNALQINENDKEKIYHLNAEKLLKL
jgi:predicted TIM-barrel fold metal-dependent hydrolase